MLKRADNRLLTEEDLENYQDLFVLKKEKREKVDKRYSELFQRWKQQKREGKQPAKEYRKEAKEKIKLIMQEVKHLRGTAKETKKLAKKETKAQNKAIASLLQDKAELLSVNAQLNTEIAELVKENRDSELDNDFLVRYAGNKDILERRWQKAMINTGVTDEQVKLVGKLEHDLNKAVGWFTRHYKCQLGVVVNKIAKKMRNSCKTTTTRKHHNQGHPPPPLPPPLPTTPGRTASPSRTIGVFLEKTEKLLIPFFNGIKNLRCVCVRQHCTCTVVYIKSNPIYCHSDPTSPVLVCVCIDFDRRSAYS